MPFDRLHIFNKVNFFLRKENQFFSSSDLHQIIGVDSQRRVSEDIGFPKSNFSSVVASGGFTVSTPSDFIKVDETKDATWKDKSGVIDLPSARQTSIGRANILSATPSSPTNYFMESESQVGVHPPSTSGTIVVPYIKSATSLSTDTDTNEITSQAYMAMTYWTLQEAFERDNDQTRANKYRAFYESEKMRIKRRYSEMFEIEKDIKPDDRYL